MGNKIDLNSDESDGVTNMGYTYDTKLNFIVPKEGTSFWIDTIAIPVGAKNKRLAEEFINLMFRPKSGAK